MNVPSDLNVEPACEADASYCTYGSIIHCHTNNWSKEACAEKSFAFQHTL